MSILKITLSAACFVLRKCNCSVRTAHNASIWRSEELSRANHVQLSPVSRPEGRAARAVGSLVAAWPASANSRRATLNS